MKSNYRILSSYFKYSNPGEYKIFYIGEEPKTNQEIVDIYKQNKGYSVIDLMLIEDLTWENEIQLNPEDTYAWFVVEIDDTYRFLKTITTSAEYNDVIVNYNGVFRLLTDFEFKTLTSDDLMRFVCKDKYPDVSFKVGNFVVASSIRFNGVQEIISTKKESDGRTIYLVENIWCNAVDLKKWIPKVHENVVVKIQLAQINLGSIDGYGITRYYTVIMKVKEVLDNTVLLEDYSSAKFEDLTPLEIYKGIK